MKNLAILLSIALLSPIGVTSTAAATVSLSRSTREVTPEELAGGAPAGYVHDFFLTSDTDLLSFGRIGVDVPLFHDAFGTDSARPIEGLSAVSSAITADSYLTTPGNTIVLGGGFGGTENLWGDLVDTGPLQNFHFARLTVNQTGSFRGLVAVGSNHGPVYLPFDFTLPGNQSDLSLLESEPSYSLDYSINAPAPTIPTPQPPVVPPTVPTLPTPQPPTVPIVPPTAPTIPVPSHPQLPMGAISLARQSRSATAEEIAGGAPAGGMIHEFFVTSATDILSVNKVKIDVPLFQHELGGDLGPAPAALSSIDSSVSADSYIDTPGDTLTLGGGFASTTLNNLWGDLSDDGPQEDFLLARLTVGETGIFAGEVSVSGNGQVISLPFDFLLPGNESDMALLAGEKTYAMEYPLVAPPIEPLPTIPTPPATKPDPVGPRLPSEPPIVETPPELPPIVVAPVDPPVSDPPTEPTEDEVPPAITQLPLGARPIEWLIDTTSIDIALPYWRFGDVDGDMPTWVDVRQWHINNAFTLVDGTGLLVPSVATLYAYDGATSPGITLGELRLSGNTFDGAGLNTLLGAAAQDSVIPEPAASLLAAISLITLRATRRRSP